MSDKLEGFQLISGDSCLAFAAMFEFVIILVAAVGLGGFRMGLGIYGARFWSPPGGCVRPSNGHWDQHPRHGYGTET